MNISLKDNLKRNKGITLIALVITIIVLLILAGVSIVTLTGDNGILNKAQSAKVETEKANEKELIDLAVLNSKMNDKNDLSIDKQKLGDALSEIDGLTGLPSDTNYATSIIFPLEVTGKSGTKYVIDEEGNVSVKTGEIPGQPDETTGLFTETSRINGGAISANNPTIPAGFKPIDTVKNVVGWTPTLFQEEFNEMIKPVAKYRGFYVGRYETRLNNATADSFGDSDSTTVQSKAGVKSANATLSKTNAWYGLYNMSKTYAPKENTNKSVVSSMIWGSQYDAMMRWMQKNNIDVTSVFSTKLQNAERNETRVTGASDSKDILNNIYDILGNGREWTLEAFSDGSRVCRGGNYDSRYVPSCRDSYDATINYYDYCGSRLTLYIK